MSKNADSICLQEAFRNRRTIYALNKDMPISDERVEELVKHAILHTPSSFNSQSARIVLLLKDEHEKYFETVRDVLRPLQEGSHWENTSNRIDGFKKAYGSILFFEDQNVIQGLEEKMPFAKHYFPQWSEHTSAMHQYALWTALTAEGCGANLQHYTLAESPTKQRLNLPESWTLKAHIVFGGKGGGPNEKTFQPAEERYKVFGK